MRKAASVLVALLSVPLLSIGAAKPRKPTPRVSAPSAPAVAVHANVTREADGQRSDLAFDGPLLGWAAPKNARGARIVFALIGRSPDSRTATSCGVDPADSTDSSNDARLFRWDPQSSAQLEEVRSGLPDGTLDASDLDGDGVDELLLLREGAIDEIPLESLHGAKGPLKRVVTDDALGRPIGDPRAARTPAGASDPLLRATVAGEFRTYRRDASGAFVSATPLALPIGIGPGRTHVDVDTPEVVAIGHAPSGAMLYATAMVPIDTRRLKTVLLEPDASPDVRATECWEALPGAERPLDVAFAIVDGLPTLVVTTMSAEKLNVFGEKMLRVYTLGGDRTRVGGAPRFAATTGLNLWQMGYPVVADLDRDGRDDLVIGYWKGLERTIAAVEVYRGRPDGTFAKPRSMEMPLKNGDPRFLSFGADADGDGRPDLIVLADRNAVVFPGAPGDRAASRPVLETPSRRMPLPPDAPHADPVRVSLALDGVTISRSEPGLGTPRPLDLDGDGQVELVFAGEVGGRARVSVIQFRGAAPAGSAPVAANPPRSSR